MIIWIVYFASFIFLGNASEPKKIVGGEITTILNYPHVVSIQHNKEHLCGGAIISSYHILTTATCVILEDNNVYWAGLKVFSGSFDLRDNEHSAPVQISYVKLIIHHKDFSAQNFWIHDIAVLRLLEPIHHTIFHHEAILPSPDYRRTKLSTAGWGHDGSLENELEVFRFLQKLDIVELFRENCESRYGLFHPNQGCAEGVTIGSYVTPGDAGAPLTSCQRVIGLVSVLNVGDAPFVFTRVYPYNRWIKTHIESY